MLVFEERGNRSSRKKPPGAEQRTNKLNPHMTPDLVCNYCNYKVANQLLTHVIVQSHVFFFSFYPFLSLYSFNRSLGHTFIPPFVRPSIRPSIHPSIHVFNHLPTHSFVRLFLLLFICLLISFLDTLTAIRVCVCFCLFLMPPFFLV